MSSLLFLFLFFLSWRGEGCVFVCIKERFILLSHITPPTRAAATVVTTIATAAATIMESADKKKKKVTILEINKTNVQEYFRDAKALIVQLEQQQQQFKGERGGTGVKINFGFGIMNVPSIMEELLIPSQELNSKIGDITYKIISNNHAHVCYFHIGNTSRSIDYLINPSSIGCISKELINFIKCLELLSKRLEKEQNIEKIIFTQMVSNSEIWDLCKNEIEIFAQNMEQRKIKVYCVSENKSAENLQDLYIC